MELRRFIEELSWLPEKPNDGSKSKEFETVQDVITAASYRPDWMNVTKLAKRVNRFAASEHSIEPLERARVWVTGNVTLNYLEPALAAAAPRHGLLADIRLSQFGQILQPFLTLDSELEDFSPQVVVVYLDILPLLMAEHRDLSASDKEKGSSTVVCKLFEQIATLSSIARERFRASVIVTTTPFPPDRLFGAIDEITDGTQLNRVMDFNRRLVKESVSLGVSVTDIAGMAHTIGAAAWRSERMWNMGKITPSMEIAPLAADVILRTLAATRGKSRRCLVLDLDNTLWGGVVGDDGVENLRIGTGDAIGEAHVAIQRVAKNLSKRGVVLAVCSKNDHKTAILPFTERTEMLLKLEDIAVFQANWQDKASNIETIASALDLGLSSFVFLDDNPVERAQVRSRLPEVAVPELPNDPADFSTALMAAGYFESVAFSTEDRDRAGYYAANAKRAEIRSKTVNLDDFLKSLDMKLRMGSFSSETKRRAFDLFNKTNQFNTTTERYSEAQVEVFADSATHITIQASLQDQFGDNGIISALVAKQEGASWRISNWVMSCRVLGRRVEDGMLRFLAQEVKRRNGSLLVADFIPTNRNGVVSDLYSRLGFTCISKAENGGETWHLEIAQASTDELPFETEIVS